MARLQILELPEGADDERPPFVLVIDQAGEDLAADIASWPRGIAERIGARHVICFSESVEIPANEVPVDPDGYPLKFHVEPDFEGFREQVQDELRKAQAELSGVLRQRQ